MAANATNARRARWERAFSKYQTLNHNLDQAQPQERDALERAIAAQQDELLDLPSPSFAAVIQKLQILWEAELDNPDQASEEKRLILEDLQDLSRETSELLA